MNFIPIYCFLVYVHDKDDKMWLNFFPPPIEIRSTLFHLSPDIISLDISVNVMKKTILNKPPMRYILKRLPFLHVFSIMFLFTCSQIHQHFRSSFFGSEKLLEILLYKKAAFKCCWPVVNFINILRASFLYKSTIVKAKM